MSDRAIDINHEIRSVSFDSQEVDQHIVRLTLGCNDDDDVKTVAMLFHYKELLEKQESIENGSSITIDGDTEDKKLKNAYDRGRRDERAFLSKNYVLKKK